MARKSSKKSKSLFDKQSTKGGWQINNIAEQKKSGSGSFLLFLLLVIGIALIGGSFLLSSGDKIISISSTEDKSDNNGKIVHVTGELNSATFKDPMFQISHTGIGLNRIVEIYQWVESGGTYNKEWKSEIIVLQNDSAASEVHSNPSEMPFFSESWKVDKIKFGSFELSESLEKKVITYKPMQLTEEDFAKLNEHGQKAFKLFEGKYFFGVDPNVPKIGDLRVSFEAASVEKYTILAKQQGNTLVGYTGDAGLIEEARIGTVDLKTMSSAIESSDNSLLTWILRIAGAGALLLSVIIAVFGKKKTLTNMNSLKPVVNLSSNNPYKTAETSSQKESEDSSKQSDDFSNYDDDFAEELQPVAYATGGYSVAPARSETVSVDSLESDFQSPKNASSDISDFIPYNDEDGIESGVEVISGDDFYTPVSAGDNDGLDSTLKYQDSDIPDRIEIVETSNLTADSHGIKTLDVPESLGDGGIAWEASTIDSGLEPEPFIVEEVRDLPHPQDFQTTSSNEGHELKANEGEENSSSVMDFVSKNISQDFKTSTTTETDSNLNIKEENYKDTSFKP